MIPTRKTPRSQPRILTIGFIIAVLLLTSLAPALAEPVEAPVYEAYVRTVFQLRSEPDLTSRRFHKVEGRAEVDVLEYKDDWCKIIVEKEFIGYAKTEWLWRFRSYDPSLAPNLTMFSITGVAAVNAPFTVTVADYSGNTMSAGDRFAVSETRDSAVLFPMMRDTAVIAPDAVTITPIAPYETAQPGDVIAAFTTFYNETTAVI